MDEEGGGKRRRIECVVEWGGRRMWIMVDDRLFKFRRRKSYHFFLF
jgi:hypothetical protein